MVVVFVVGNGLEIRENNRFRWVVEPVMLVVLGIAIQQLVDRYLAARRARTGTIGDESEPSPA